jgi:hypothetical protein
MPFYFYLWTPEIIEHLAEHGGLRNSRKSSATPTTKTSADHFMSRKGLDAT